MDDLKKVIKDLKEALDENDVDVKLPEKYKPVLDFDKYLEEKGYEFIGRTQQDAYTKKFKVIASEEKVVVECGVFTSGSPAYIFFDAYPERGYNYSVRKDDNQSWEDYFARAEKLLLKVGEEFHERRERLRERRRHREHL